MIALRYFSDDVPVATGDMETDRRSMDHIRKCPRCRDWLHKVVPPETLRRQSRLTRYCCASMYVAIEEPDRADIYVSFELFRGEDPCWKFDGNERSPRIAHGVAGSFLPDRSSTTRVSNS
jgi:hypothetical protein